MKIKYLWLSRHGIADEQARHWLEKAGANDEVEFVHLNIPWANSGDDQADFQANNATWKMLIDKHVPTAILGVFPPAAIEAITHNVPLFSPISEQNAVERQDGTKQIVFRHLRWSRDLNPMNKKWDPGLLNRQ